MINICPYCNKKLIFLLAVKKYGCAFCEYVAEGGECRQQLLIEVKNDY